MEDIKILIADDHPNFRKALKCVLGFEDGLKVVGESDSNQDALKKMTALLPDVILADLEDEGVDGIRLAEEIKEISPSTAIIIVTADDNSALRERAAKIGVSAYILKEDIVDDLLPAIRQTKIFSNVDC
ncbi:MAG: response regulator transcription factor [Actinobacteria bacterium]|nr:response regulator transcription factor [Actinomycetota bacterium]